jgi:predicted metalloprotease
MPRRRRAHLSRSRMLWAKSTQQPNLLESGDVESALGATAAVGDDRLQCTS